jgi:hypothetical protein
MLKFLIIVVLSYILFRFVKKALSSPSSVKGQARNNENKKQYNSNIEDAEFEDLDK